jgi:GntR family transcriptional regulator, rspAB operon transcriptional repressor
VDYHASIPVGPLTLGTRTAVRASGHVYDTLREAIVTTELVPGRRLSEAELAGILGVSRTPIREALVRLRDDRLVEIVPQLGTFVARISHGAIEDAQFVRESLECAAIRIAAERATPADVKTLGRILDRQADTRDDGDVDGFYALDDELHAALCHLSGHDVAWSLAGRANGHLNRIRRLSLPQPNYLAEMVTEHHAVVDAVAANDPDAADAALRHHLRMVLSALGDLQSQYPDYFEEDGHGRP